MVLEEVFAHEERVPDGEAVREGRRELPDLDAEILGSGDLRVPGSPDVDTVARQRGDRLRPHADLDAPHVVLGVETSLLEHALEDGVELGAVRGYAHNLALEV